VTVAFGSSVWNENGNVHVFADGAPLSWFAHMDEELEKEWKALDRGCPRKCRCIHLGMVGENCHP